jgi:PAS domain S-box-containing protein
MKILLLEDNETDADLTRKGLTGSIPNCYIEVAQTLKQASKILENSTAFDIALLDMKLPDGTGMDLLIEIRQSGIRMPVVILTGSGNEEVATAAMKAGADDYIVKRQDYISKLPGLIDMAIQNHQQNMLLKSEIVEVLYIEHHASDIDLTKRHLNQYAPQIHITALSSAEKALNLLPLNETEQGKFQVIILDYRLPGLNALEFTKIIRQERKLQVPVIFVTGQGNEEVAIQALKLGANEYLVKRDNYLYRLPTVIMNSHQHYQLIQKQVALVKSESKYRLLAENSGDVIFTADLEMKYTYVSPSVYQLRDYTSEEVMQQSVEETLSPASFAIVMKVFSDSMAEIYSSQTGKFEPVTLELEMRRKDDSYVWTEVKATIIFDENNLPVNILGVTRDISVKRKYEQELVKAKEKAEESDRLKSAFLANMSHEIRTPMNGILGFSELLKEPDLSSEEQSEYIEYIEKSGARMLNIISEIMDISKIESGLMEIYNQEININEKLNDAYVLLKPDAESKKIHLSFKNYLSDKKAITFTDSNKLNTILTNLIKNAIKYTDKGSIVFGCELKDETFEFFVKDTGIGIPKDRQEAIFERFIQADIQDVQARQGAGLGLSISKAFVEMLGGRIWVESEGGNGSVFYFTIPYQTKPSKNILDEGNGSNQDKSFANIPIVSRLKILIVEDDEASKMFLSILTKDYSRELLQASNGLEAIEICRNNPDIDLILMDINIPEMSGYNATRQIRQFNQEVVIIAQTAYGLVGDREKSIQAGCNDYISKPIDKGKLIELIHMYTQ